MASVVGSTAAKQVALTLYDIHDEKTNKVFLVGAATSNATIQNIIDNTMNLSNTRAAKGTVTTGAQVSGMPAQAINSPYDAVSMAVALVFSQVSPYNPAVTLFKTYIIPAAIVSLIQNDHKSVIVPDVTATAATPPKILGDLVAELEANLTAYIKSNNEYVVGGWTYQPSESKLVTFLRELNGVQTD